MKYGKFDNLVAMSTEIKVMHTHTEEVYYQGASGAISDAIYNNIKKYEVKSIDVIEEILYIFVVN